MTEILFAGIAQDRAPATSLAGGEVSNPLPRSTSFNDPLSWQLGFEDARAGRPWRVGPAEIIARTFEGDRDVLSYLYGHHDGERERARERTREAADAHAV